MPPPTYAGGQGSFRKKGGGRSLPKSKSFVEIAINEKLFNKNNIVGICQKAKKKSVFGLTSLAKNGLFIHAAFPFKSRVVPCLALINTCNVTNFIQWKTYEC